MVWVVVLWMGVSWASYASKPLVVPQSLAPWQDWVLQDHTQLKCPLWARSTQQRACVWPGHLKLGISEYGVAFEQGVTLLDQAWVALPGDATVWPQQVRAGGQPLWVVALDGVPSVLLQPGQHQLVGQLHWQQAPQFLQIPPAQVLLEVVHNGVPATPRRDAQGRLWLSQSADAAEPSENRIAHQVFRLFVDQEPLRMRVRLRLQVSGQPREVVIAGVLLPGFELMALQSPLPARLSAQDLRLQVRPGQYDIDVLARASSSLRRIGGAVVPEVWAFAPVPDLRRVGLSGLPPVDPKQTDLPKAWQQYPSFQARPKAFLQIEEHSRGNQTPQDNRLSLERDLWLDFDGEGMTVRDYISGEMHQKWALTMGPDLTVGRAEVDGVPSVITQVGHEARVDLRRHQLAVSVVSRADDIHQLPVTGWLGERFESVRAQLHLPPGWSLWHAFGVDRAKTWVSQWRLWDVFVLLLVVLGVRHLLGGPVAILTLLTLLVTFHTPGAPKYLWVNFVLALAVLRGLASGRLSEGLQWYVRGSLVVLVLVALPYGVDQARQSVYPQLAHAPLSPSVVRTSAPEAPKAEASMLLERTADADAQPNRLAQTGPGLPTWQWRRVDLRWSGAVSESERLQLWLLPPWANRFLSAARVLLLAGLLLCLGRALLPMAWPKSLSVWLLPVGLGLMSPGPPNRCRTPNTTNNNTNTSHNRH